MVPTVMNWSYRSLRWDKISLAVPNSLKSQLQLQVDTVYLLKCIFMLEIAQIRSSVLLGVYTNIHKMEHKLLLMEDAQLKLLASTFAR